VFEQAHADAKAAGVFAQVSSPSSTPLAAPMGDPLDELEAVFEQAHANAKAAGVFAQTQSTGTPAKVELDELEAAFEAAAEAARVARAAGVAAAPPLPAHVPMPGPAEVPPQHGLLRPQLAKRSEAVRRRLARRHETTVPALPPVPVEKFHRWLRFQMAGQSYAVELLKVQEVQRVPDVLPVRGAAPHVVGVMNLRGQIVQVISLRQRLSLGACAGATERRVVVLEQDGTVLGLLVDAVAEVFAANADAINETGLVHGALPADWFRGLLRRGNDLVVALDASRLLAH
jgi:purine-binding chemotaxis protein CheW